MEDTKNKSKILYKYLTDPEFTQRIDITAIEIGKKLPVEDITNQLALFGNCLLMQIEGETVVIDDSCFSITFSKEKLRMLPKSTIIISPNGDSRIEGKEGTDNCYELSELGKAAGRVVKDEEKDHTPVHHSAHNTIKRG